LINNDQYIEFCIGAPGHDTRGLNAGRAYIYNTSYTGIEDSYFSKTRNDSMLRIISGTIVNSGQPIVIKCQILENLENRLKVFDVLGRIVYSKKIRSQQGVSVLPVLPSGVYSAILQIGPHIVNSRLILLR